MFIPLLSLSLAPACTDKATDDSGPPDTEDSAAVALGIPEGEGEWLTEYSCGATEIWARTTIVNEGGALSAEAEAWLDAGMSGPAVMGETLTGTTDPATGWSTLVALDFTRGEGQFILNNFHARYDAESGELVGEVLQPRERDGADAGCSDFTAVPAAGAGTPSRAAAPDRALPAGTSRFIGTFQCVENVWWFEMSLDYAAGEAVTGTLRFGADEASAYDPWDLLGTHDPASGRLTLAPGEWAPATGEVPRETNYLSSGFDLVFDPTSGALSGRVAGSLVPCTGEGLVGTLQ